MNSEDKLCLFLGEIFPEVIRQISHHGMNMGEVAAPVDKFYDKPGGLYGVINGVSRRDIPSQHKMKIIPAGLI